MRTVRVIPALGLSKQAKELAINLRPLVAQLETLGAFPTSPESITLLIVLEGARSRPIFRNIWDAVKGMGTINTPGDENDDAVIVRKPGSECVILVSKRFYEESIGSALAEAGNTNEAIGIFFIAHEVHHISEPERQNSCGITIRESDHKILRGAQPHFPVSWIAAARALASLDADKNDLNLKFALDAFDEGSADMTGLWFAREANLPWEKLCCAMSEYRKAKYLPGYGVGWLLDEFLKEELPDSRKELYTRCWRKAFTLAMTSHAVSEQPDVFRALAMALMEDTSSA